MSLKKYAKYKNSGVKWLGEVPVHWETKRLGDLFIERREKVSDKDFDPLSVTKNGVVSQLDTAAKTDDGDNRKKVCVGDFVINGRSDRKGSSGIAYQDGSVSLINIVLQSREMAARFVHYLLRSQPFQEEFYRYGKGIVADLWSTNFSEMKNIIMSTPSSEEQSRISQYLDREIAKIDDLIIQQRQLTELLKEKRQATISHAVTRGLNQYAPMKESGVEWLGVVPEHWALSKLGFESWVRARLGWKGLKAEEYVDNGFIFLATPNIKGIDIDFENVNYINEQRYEESPEIKLREGDVLLAKDGSTLGIVNVIRRLDRPSTVNSSIAVITPHQNLHGIFLYYLFQSSFMKNIIEITKGGMGVPHLFQEDINKFRIPMPPFHEQVSIATHLDRQTAKIDALTDAACNAITLLQERRTTLISSAVTGKIDVRGITQQEVS